MVSVRDSVLLVFTTLSLAFATPAQENAEIIVTEQVLPAGGQVDIDYENPGMNGGMVKFTMHNGLPENAESVWIQVSSSGSGGFQWLVPESWEMACISAPEAEHLTLPVEEVEN